MTKIAAVGGVVRRSLQPALLPIRLLLSASADGLRKRITEAGVARTFFICSTPRTGSTMLGDLLADTQLVGRAGEEFGEAFLQDVVPRMGLTGFDDYVVECTRKRRGTDALGIKLHWHQVEVFLPLLRRRRGLRGLSDGAVIEAVFPGVRYVWLRRRDEVAQAVSWWKAMATGKWVDRQAEAEPPCYDQQGIATRLRQVRNQNASWSRWFEVNSVEPIAVTYEDLVAEPNDVVRELLAFFGVEAPATLSVSPRTLRQGDDSNVEWARRFREQSGLQAQDLEESVGHLRDRG